MSLEVDETTLRDGYRLKVITDHFVVLNDGGMAVGKPVRTETYAVRRLIELRMQHVRRQRERAQREEAARA